MTLKRIMDTYNSLYGADSINTLIDRECGNLGIVDDTDELSEILNEYGYGGLSDYPEKDIPKEYTKTLHYNPFTELNDDSVYLLGIIVGTGGLFYRKDRPVPYSLTISNVNKELIDIVCDIFRFSQEDRNKYIHVIKNKHTIEYRVTTWDYATTSSLKTLGVKARKKENGYKYSLPMKFLNSFTRGIFDSSGKIISLSNNKLGVYLNGDESYLQFIKENTDFKWKEYKNSRNNPKRIRLGLYQQSEIAKLYQWLYSDGKHYLKENKDTFEEYLNKGEEA